MASAIGVRDGYDAGALRAAAKRSKDGPHARRLLALGAFFDGATRSEAAKIGGVGLQVVRDWVLKYNAQGPDGLIDRKAPGQPPRLNEAHRAALAAILESGPIPAVHGVVRWRIVDLRQWIFEEFRVVVAVQTLSRVLRAMAPGSSPIGANISGPCIGTCVFVLEARADGGPAPPAGVAGKPGSARA